MSTKQDNTTLARKAALRIELLRQMPEPLVLETHGRKGRIWARCYSHLNGGTVLEKDPALAELLAAQRPTWAVYEANAERALSAGLAGDQPVNLLDVDPDGDPWPALEAWFTSDRQRAERLGVCASDGLRAKLDRQSGRQVASMGAAAEAFGAAALAEDYLAVCRWNLERIASGYEVSAWAGLYTGRSAQMTHFAAVLERESERRA